MTVLVTGAAGFIGFHVSTTLLRAGESVIGIDNLNPYYDVRLKEARLAELRKHAGFSFERLELAEERALLRFVERNPGIDRVVHLAAQAGVRHSLEEPRAKSPSAIATAIFTQFGMNLVALSSEPL